MNSSDQDAKSTGTGAAVGAATGGLAGGAAAGAAVGGMTGPVGAAIGAAVGLGAGALGGKAASDSSTSPGGSSDGSSMHTVIGAFDDTSTAQRAVERLVQAGFDRDDVHLQHDPDGMVGDQPETRTERKSGGFFASLFGMDDADDTPIRNQYADHAYTFDEAARRGSPVVVVDARDERQADEASSLLHELGAIDVNERASKWRAEGWQPPVTGGRQSLAAGQGTTSDQDQVLEVVEEELQVGKRTLNRGGVRVVQRVSAKPVREVIRLREEHAVVERRPVDRPATVQDLSSPGQEAIELRDTVEEAVVAKTARVVEEVRVGTEVRNRDETIEETVRRKDVDVERLEGQPSRTEARESAVASDSSLNRPSRPGNIDKPGL